MGGAMRAARLATGAEVGGWRMCNAAAEASVMLPLLQRVRGVAEGADGRGGASAAPDHVPEADEVRRPLWGRRTDTSRSPFDPRLISNTVERPFIVGPPISKRSLPPHVPYQWPQPEPPPAPPHEPGRKLRDRLV